MSSGQSVVVLGGTSGVGANIADHLASLGHPVAVLGPPGDRVQDPDTPGAPRHIPVDIDAFDTYGAAIAAAHELLGRIDVLVNALDQWAPTTLDEITPRAWQDLLDHNLTAVFFACQAAVPFLRERGGAIVNLSSARAQLAAPGQLAYAAAKAGVAAMTRDLATDLGRYRITCNSVQLGVDGTGELLAQAPLTGADVCETVEFLIGRGAQLALDAFDYPADGGLSVQRDVVPDLTAPIPVEEGAKVAIITGASSGLGAEAARIFARRGLRVAILDVLDEDGERVAEEICGFGPQCEAAYFHCDISSTAQVTAAVDAVANRFGRIDILLNSAAVTSRKRTPEITETDWDRFMEIDLWGPFITTMTVAPFMRAVGGGRVLNFSSMLSTLAHGRHTLYGGAKEAMNSMTRAMAAGLKDANIQVFSILPAYVMTPMIAFRLQDREWLERNFRQSLSQVLLYPEHVSEVFWHLATSRTQAANGHKIYVDTGYLNFRYKLVPWPEPTIVPDGQNGVLDG